MLTMRTLVAVGAVFALGITAAVGQQAPTGTTAPTVVAVAAPAATVTAPRQTTPPPPTGIADSFKSLPPGERSIADTLYEAQRGPHRWSRDQIATAKLSGDGWGQIFHEMRRDGLIHAKSLGQVIRRDADRHFVRRDRDDFDHHGHHEHHDVAHHDRDDHHFVAQRLHHEVTVTSASGASQVVSHGGWRHNVGSSGAGSQAVPHSTGATGTATRAPVGTQFSETAMVSGTSAAMHHGATAHHGK